MSGGIMSEGEPDEATGGPDDHAVQAVLVEVQRDLLRFLVGRLGNRDEALDVLHEFYVRVLTRLGDLRESDKLRAWMRRVLATTLVDHYRAQGRRRRSEAEYGELQASGLLGSDDDTLDGVICACLYKLLPTLKPSDADLIWRLDLVGEARAEVAALLGITEGNLRVRLHRARQALRRRLEETCRSCPVHGFLDCDCPDETRLRAGLG